MWVLSNIGTHLLYERLVLNMIIKTVTGAGYGDEGKGLMTDYFCEKLHNNRVLNIKVNGGAQAGHTVCRLDKETGEYKHWVFRQYGSGTFAGADTYLARTFMVNFSELVKEQEKLEEIYDNNTKLYIDKRCRVTLPCDIVVNRMIEEHRTHRHGSCGLGIFETFNRNNTGDAISVNDIVRKFINLHGFGFSKFLDNLSEKYIKARVAQIKESDNIIINDAEVDKVLTAVKEMNNEFIDSFLKVIRCNNINFYESLNDILSTENYGAIVFECSQGLELDQYNTRNFPHLTPSNTGLRNVATVINETKKLQNGEIENCFVTRSYKTKHGAGLFIEEDNTIVPQFSLYDRTNQRNPYQGTIKYGRLNMGRMKKLIFEQVQLLRNEIKEHELSQSTTLSITHLDQTNECLILVNSIENYRDVDLSVFDNHYLSFGEKASDII